MARGAGGTLLPLLWTPFTRRHATAHPRRVCGSRCEFWIFGCNAEMTGQKEVQLYAVTNDGELKQYNRVTVLGAKHMPSGGDLTNEADREAIRALEDQMLGAYGNVIVRKGCAAVGESGNVHLAAKMLRAEHLPALSEASLQAGGHGGVAWLCAGADGWAMLT